MKKIFLFLIVGIVSISLAVPAMALHLEPYPGVKLEFYATNNFSTEYTSTDRKDTGKDKDELQWDISNTFGAFASVGNFSGKWELGFQGPAHLRTNGGIYSRLLYGTYAFSNKLKLTMGQTYFPNFWWPLGSETKEGNTGTGYGASQDARTPMIRIDYGPVYIIAAKVNESVPPTVKAADSHTDTTRKLPKLMAGFDTSVGKHKVGAGVGYQTHDIESSALDLNTEVVSWTAFVHGQFQVTDALTLKSQVIYAQNIPQFGIFGHGSLTTTGPAEKSADAQLDGDRIENSDTFAGFINAFYKIDSAKQVFAGYGYSQSKNDLVNDGEKNAKQEYYAGAQITVYEIPEYGVKMYVVPEFHVFDYMDDEFDKDEGSDTYIGARWKLKF